MMAWQEEKWGFSSPHKVARAVFGSAICCFIGSYRLPLWALRGELLIHTRLRFYDCLYAKTAVPAALPYCFSLPWWILSKPRLKSNLLTHQEEWSGLQALKNTHKHRHDTKHTPSKYQARVWATDKYSFVNLGTWGKRLLQYFFKTGVQTVVWILHYCKCSLQ